jgi:hypothetical protein
MPLGLLPCPKVSFATKESATYAIRTMQAEDTRRGGRPLAMRMYRCVSCNGWHISRVKPYAGRRRG